MGAAGSVASVRQVISWRFVASIAALLGLTALVWLAFGDRQSVAEVVKEQTVDTRRADLISIVLSTSRQDFALDGGVTTGTMTMQVVPVGTLEPRPVPVFAGTPGVITCENLDGTCALLAETLGDTIVWFALVPMGANFRFELPAIDSLDGGWAHLVNGWEVPYATIIDRRCDSPAESFSEFLRLVGPNHRSIYDLGRGAITTVVC